MLLSKEIKEIQFNQVADLKSVVDHLEGFKFKQSDDVKIHEFICLYIFLIGGFKLKKLSFPIKIISRESPDFVIHQGENREIGLEHTRATLESLKIAQSELEKRPEGSFIELCHYSPYKNILTRQSDTGIISPGDPLKGEGWVGNQVEYEWAEVILNALKNKVNKLNKPHFEIKKENILFIEDDSHVDFIKHEDEAIQILKQQYNQIMFSEKHVFDKICISSINTLVYDVFRECIKIPLRKEELPNIDRCNQKDWTF